MTHVCVIDHWGHLPTIKIINSIPIYYSTHTHATHRVAVFVAQVFMRHLFTTWNNIYK